MVRGRVVVKRSARCEGREAKLGKLGTVSYRHCFAISWRTERSGSIVGSKGTDRT